MIILGIDPGFAITGYGIIKQVGNRFQVIDFGAIITHAGVPLPKRLLTLTIELESIIARFQPDVVAVEELFFCNNAKTAIAVGHGRGVAVTAAARAGLEVYEYTPMQVKQAVVGYGRAAKGQIQQMVKAILGLPEIPKPDDVADALAVAICHANSSQISDKDSRFANNKM
ncbi:MAG: crossover junction endodeoxyribonuclease RuvC [Bacillota bacterium]